MDDSNDMDEFLEELEQHGDVYFIDEDDKEWGELEEVPEDESGETQDAPPPDEDEIEIEVIDQSEGTFDKHGMSVFTSDISKDGTLAITGGQDDMAYVWNTTTQEVLFECTGHKDSVTEVGFNHNDQYVATGDMSGLIQVWSIKDKKLTWCYEGEELAWLMWHPLANVLMYSGYSGEVYVWQIPSGNCKVLPSPSSAACCSAQIVMPGGKELLTAYEDGSVRLWDIKSVSAVWTTKENSSIDSIHISPDGALAITAPEAKLLKLSDGKVLNTLLANEETAIETAIFLNDLSIVVTGSLTGQLAVWHLGIHKLGHREKVEGAVTVIKRGRGNLICVGSNKGDVYVCDARACNLVKLLTGHRGDIFSISTFKDGNKILTTSDDGTAKIFDIANS